MRVSGSISPRLLTACLMALLGACGGGGGGTTGTVAPAAPSVQIQFPPDNALYDDDVITVSGTAHDAQGDAIASIRVNNIAAQSDDGFATWSVSLPLTVGENRVVVETEDDKGNRAAEADVVTFQVRAFPGMRSATEGGLLIDKANHQVFVGDGTLKALYAFDLETGQRSVLASSRAVDKLRNDQPVGNGPEMVLPRQFVTGDGAARPLFLIGATKSARKLLEFNPNTGESEIVFDPNNTGGKGAEMRLLRSAILDKNNNRLLVMDGFNGGLRVLAVNLDNENRTLLSGEGKGSGPGLDDAESMYFDNDTNHLFVVDNRGFGSGGVPSRRLLSINLANGNRTVLSSSGENVGAGPGILAAGSLDFDPATQRFLIADTGRKALLLVNRDSGDRTVVSGMEDGKHVGEGPAFIQVKAARFLDSYRAVVVDRELEVPLIVDLGSGERRLLPNNAVGTGARFEEPRAMVRFDNALLVADKQANALVLVDLNNGDRTVLAGEESGLRGPALLALDVTGGRVLFIDDTNNAPRLMALQRQTRSLSVVSGDDAAGPALVNPVSQVLDAKNNRVLVADEGGQRIVAIDLVRGERTVLLQDLPVRGGESGASLALREDGNTLLMLAGGDGMLLAFNLTTGERTTLSGKSPDTDTQVGGPAASLFSCFGVSLDETAQALFASCEGDVRRVDLVSGQVSTVSGFELDGSTDRGAGPGFQSTTALVRDPDNRRLLVLDRARRAVMAVSLNSGDRVVISWTDVIP